MAERRPLVAGLKTGAGVDPNLEKQFVYGEKPEAAPAKPGATPPDGPREGKGPAAAGMVPFTSRVRADYGAALKRASLERQLSGQLPNTVQDILEDALGPWLRANGYVQ
jgi:hypothetical protein